jgi:hypothetical protein
MGQHNATVRRELVESICKHDLQRLAKICDIFDITKIWHATYHRDSPLHIAVSRLNPHFEIIELLTKRYPQFIESTNSSGWTPGHMAAHVGLIEVIKLFGKINPRAFAIQDNRGITPLYQAVSERHYFVAKSILKVAADTVDTADRDGKTPLHVAVTHFNIKNSDFMIAFLISCGSQAINRRDNNGDTPLHSHLKTEFCNRKTIITLIRFGADLDAINNDGDKPMNSVIRRHLSLNSDTLFHRGINLAKMMVALTVGTKEVGIIRCSEQKVFNTRYTVYFDYSLVSRLLFYCP